MAANLKFSDDGKRQEKVPHSEQVRRLNRRIKSKKGYVSYLKARQDDPAPLLALIKRQREIAEEHLRIADHYQAIVDAPQDALLTAETELANLQAELDALSPPSAPSLQKKIDSLEAQIAAALNARKEEE